MGAHRIAHHYATDAQGPHAGAHLIADLYECAHLTLPGYLQQVARAIAQAIGATVLGEASHHFTGGGETCILLLAESHITLHSWPETGYVAMDIFTCGAIKPENAIGLAEGYLKPRHTRLGTIRRGDPASLILRQPAQ